MYSRLHVPTFHFLLKSWPMAMLLFAKAMCNEFPKWGPFLGSPLTRGQLEKDILVIGDQLLSSLLTEWSSMAMSGDLSTSEMASRCQFKFPNFPHFPIIPLSLSGPSPCRVPSFLGGEFTWIWIFFLTLFIIPCLSFHWQCGAIPGLISQACGRIPVTGINYLIKWRWCIHSDKNQVMDFEKLFPLLIHHSRWYWWKAVLVDAHYCWRCQGSVQQVRGTGLSYFQDWRS